MFGTLDYGKFNIIYLSLIVSEYLWYNNNNKVGLKEGMAYTVECPVIGCPVIGVSSHSLYLSCNLKKQTFTQK